MTCEDAEDASAAAHVQHDLVLEEMLVALNSVHVGAGAHLVLEHFLMNVEVRVAVEVVVGVLLVACVRYPVPPTASSNRRITSSVIAVVVFLCFGSCVSI